MANEKSKQKPAFEIDELAAIALRHGAAPLRVYVGIVVAVDAYGVRLTLVDWIVHQFIGNDFFAPWQSIESALIATIDQDEEMFLDSAGRFQAALAEAKS